MNSQVIRPDMEAHPDPNPIEYEDQVYQKGLKYSRPPFTFKSTEWEGLAQQRMSAESAGYVVGVSMPYLMVPKERTQS